MCLNRSIYSQFSSLNLKSKFMYVIIIICTKSELNVILAFSPTKLIKFPQFHKIRVQNVKKKVLL